MPLTLDVLLFNLCDLTHVVHKILVSTRTWSRLSCKFHKRGTLSGPINHKTRKRSLWSCYSWQNQWIESRLSNKAAKFEKNDDLQIRIELKVKSVPILAARSSTFEHYMKIEGIDISYKPKSAKDWRNIKGYQQSQTSISRSVPRYWGPNYPISASSFTVNDVCVP